MNYAWYSPSGTSYSLLQLLYLHVLLPLVFLSLEPPPGAFVEFLGENFRELSRVLRENSRRNLLFWGLEAHQQLKITRNKINSLLSNNLPVAIVFGLLCSKVFAKSGAV